MSQALSPGLLARVDAYWRAANYLSVGQIYLRDNPLLRRPLALRDVKPRLLGHWGTTPGLNLVYTHLNRVIRERDADMIFVTGPGHGGPGVVAQTYLEGTYSEIYPCVSQDEEGLKRLFTQFSFPGGIPSHAAPETPGSINEGGELGYSLAHAYGAVFDNPSLVAACVIGDGEAETGPLATSWHANKFLNPARDGAVLPILHLNGYKISSATVLARIPREDLMALFRGYGYEPREVAGSDPAQVHQDLAAALDEAMDAITAIQGEARTAGTKRLSRWPMIILRTPKGWTGPGEVDGVQVEGTWRAHQVPLDGIGTHPEHLARLEAWLRGYRPDELFDEAGKFREEWASLAPTGGRRMGANPHANGGALLRPLHLPDVRAHAVAVPAPGAVTAEATRQAGKYIRDVFRLNEAESDFRLFAPDETSSNRLTDVFDATDRAFAGAIEPSDVNLSPDGRVMEVLSEHMCQGWLEGYLLTGRHGIFTSYEAFIHIVDSMFNQHAKWLKAARALDWRKPIASLNYLLTSHVWRQDHNGYSHQDPGFIDVVVNKKADVIRVYLPSDANSLLVAVDHCLKSRDRINVVIAGKHPEAQWLGMDAAIAHFHAGAGIWHWASDETDDPHAVVACCGDVPTIEALAAVTILRDCFPHLKIRVVNVVDLMTLQPREEHPHGMDDATFQAMFTPDKPVVFAFHGYPWLIHRLTYSRPNQHRIHVHGYREEGTTTTPFDMTVLNGLDRFHLATDVVERVPALAAHRPAMRRWLADKLWQHNAYIRAHGEDMPEVRDWAWRPDSRR